MAEKAIEMNISETVTINVAGTNKTFFKGTAFVQPTDQQLIERELERLQAQRAADEATGEADEREENQRIYSKSALNKMNVEELTRVAKIELGLAVEENATKGDLVKLIADAQ